MLPPKTVDVVFLLSGSLPMVKKGKNKDNQQNNPRTCLYKPPGEVSFSHLGVNKGSLVVFLDKF